MRFKKVKLPRRFDGRELKRHPLLDGLGPVLKETSTRFLAKRFKVTQQALYDWINAARSDRDFNVPVRQVIKICRLTKQSPYVYNPDLWPDPEWRV